VAAVQRVMDLRHDEGLSTRRQKVEAVSLEDALRRADFVSLHVPLTLPGAAKEPTFHLIDEARLRLMKKTAYLVNTARGPVVDEAALARRSARAGSRARRSTCSKRSRCRTTARCAIPSSCRRCGSSRTRLGGAATRLSPDPDVGMAGRCVQGALDVLEGRYGGDPKRMPFVVNKEAF
jgi:hypothetical protein